MTQIILKENELGLMCLFDSRSQKFLKGCCVKNEHNGKELLNIANAVVRKSFKTIIEMARDSIYSDNGYLDCMIARKYLAVNPDIYSKVTEKLSQPKEDKRIKREKKGRFKNFNDDYKYHKEPVKTIETSSTETSVIETHVCEEKRKRGRPRKENVIPKMPVLINGEKRKRGRPRKAVDIK